eukprot:PhM_4_TR18079/c0_g1_i1/m.44842
MNQSPAPRVPRSLLDDDTLLLSESHPSVDASQPHNLLELSPDTQPTSVANRAQPQMMLLDDDDDDDDENDDDGTASENRPLYAHYEEQCITRGKCVCGRSIFVPGRHPDWCGRTGRYEDRSSRGKSLSATFPHIRGSDEPDGNDMWRNRRATYGKRGREFDEGSRELETRRILLWLNTTDSPKKQQPAHESSTPSEGPAPSLPIEEIFKSWNDKIRVARSAEIAFQDSALPGTPIRFAVSPERNEVFVSLNSTVLVDPNSRPEEHVHLCEAASRDPETYPHLYVKSLSPSSEERRCFSFHGIEVITAMCGVGLGLFTAAKSTPAYGGAAFLTVINMDDARARCVGTTCFVPCPANDIVHTIVPHETTNSCTRLFVGTLRNGIYLMAFISSASSEMFEAHVLLRTFRHSMICRPIGVAERVAFAPPHHLLVSVASSGVVLEFNMGTKGAPTVAQKVSVTTTTTWGCAVAVLPGPPPLVALVSDRAELTLLEVDSIVDVVRGTSGTQLSRSPLVDTQSSVVCIATVGPRSFALGTTMGVVWLVDLVAPPRSSSTSLFGGSDSQAKFRVSVKCLLDLAGASIILSLAACDGKLAVATSGEQLIFIEIAKS